MSLQVKVIEPTGKERIVDLCDTEEQFKRMTVLQLKRKILSDFGLEEYSECLELLFGEEVLEDRALLSSYRIRHMSTIHTVLKLPGRRV